MYLSKVFVQPKKLNNAYSWHQALWTLFPDVDRGVSSPFLYHIESLNLTAGAHILMQSSLKPRIQSSNVHVVAMKEFSPSFSSGQSLAFKLIANPTKKIVDIEKKHNKRNQGKSRVPLIKDEERKIWLSRKLINTACMNELSITSQQPVYFQKGSRAGKIVPVLFEGTFKIHDNESMHELLSKGIGPAKAFGCGLMLVRRV